MVVQCDLLPSLSVDTFKQHSRPESSCPPSSPSSAIDLIRRGKVNTVFAGILPKTTTGFAGLSLTDRLAHLRGNKVAEKKNTSQARWYKQQKQISQNVWKLGCPKPSMVLSVSSEETFGHVNNVFSLYPAMGKRRGDGGRGSKSWMCFGSGLFLFLLHRTWFLLEQMTPSMTLFHIHASLYHVSEYRQTKCQCFTITVRWGGHNL